MQAGVKRNFQIPEPLDFLAEFTQHIPPKGSHLIRCYGWYSNKSRGMRKMASAAAETAVESSTEESAPTGSSQAWAMLIRRVYEVDPLCCPECGGQMPVVSFIEPPQFDVIEDILKHCGLWQSRSLRAPPVADELVFKLDAAYSGNATDAPNEADESHELTYVGIDTFLANVRSSPTRIGTRTLRPGCGFTANFAFIAVHFLLRHPPKLPPISLNIPRNSRSASVQRGSRPPLHTRTTGMRGCTIKTSRGELSARNQSVARWLRFCRRKVVVLIGRDKGSLAN